MLSLPVITSQASEDAPLYNGDLAKDLGVVSRNRTAETVTGGLSYPQKMDTPAWGISATRCHVGGVLAKEPNTVCSGCYALKGTFRSPAVEKKLEAAYRGMSHPLWVPAMIFLIRYHAAERFRWFHSGDLAGVNHLRNIIRVCLEKIGRASCRERV